MLLFLESQNKQIRNEIIHLLVLLLPKAHRDVLEVFASFLKRVAQHARLFVVGREASTDAMTEENLAMTLAPYLLYPRSAQQQKLDQLEQSSSSSITGSLLTSTEAEQHAVAVVTSVIKHVAVFSKVSIEKISRPLNQRSCRCRKTFPNRWSSPRVFLGSPSRKYYLFQSIYLFFLSFGNCPTLCVFYLCAFRPSAQSSRQSSGSGIRGTKIMMGTTH